MIKSECNKEKFKFDHDFPEEFTWCFWQKQQRVLTIWVAYRLIAFLYMTITAIVIYQDNWDYVWYKHFLPFVHWAYIMEYAALTLAFIITAKKHRTEKKYPDLPPLEKMPISYKVLWIIYNIGAVSTITITIIYWFFVYTSGVPAESLKYALLTHLFNTLLVIFDMFMYAIPFRILHFYVPLIFTIIYGLFTVTYQLSGGTGVENRIPIHPLLDWRYPLRTLVTCTAHLVFTLLIFCGICSMYLLRQLKKPRVEEDEPT